MYIFMLNMALDSLQKFLRNKQYFNCVKLSQFRPYQATISTDILYFTYLYISLECIVRNNNPEVSQFYLIVYIFIMYIFMLNTIPWIWHCKINKQYFNSVKLSQATISTDIRISCIYFPGMHRSLLLQLELRPMRTPPPSRSPLSAICCRFCF